MTSPGPSVLRDCRLPVNISFWFRGLMPQSFFTQRPSSLAGLTLLGGRVSTAENVAVVFWDIVAEELGRFPGTQLTCIRIHESRANIVEYKGETQ